MNRHPVDCLRGAEWPDTLPAFHRSEAFAEDLLDHVAPLPQWRQGAPQGRAQKVVDGHTGTSSQGLRRSGSGDDDARFASLGWQGT